jgi:hypothetical protein
MIENLAIIIFARPCRISSYYFSKKNGLVFLENKEGVGNLQKETDKISGFIKLG